VKCRHLARAHREIVEIKVERNGLADGRLRIIRDLPESRFGSSKIRPRGMVLVERERLARRVCGHPLCMVQIVRHVSRVRRVSTHGACLGYIGTSLVVYLLDVSFLRNGTSAAKSSDI